MRLAPLGAAPALAVPVWLFLLACARPPPPSIAPEREELRLEAGWSVPLWRRAEGALVSTTRLELVHEGGPGSELVLRGLYWGAQVTVDGRLLPAVTGGSASTHIPLGSLSRGPHTLTLEIRPPVGVSRARTGGGRRPFALADPPVLRLLPAEHVDAVALPLADGQVSARVRVNAPDGARVRGSVWADGRRILEIPETNVTDGRAASTPLAWSGPLWAPGAPAPVQVYVELLDGEVVVDLARFTTGVREVKVGAEGLTVNGTRTVLLTERVEEGDVLSVRMRREAAGGANALEVHGVYLTEAWLEEADRLGVPLVVLPRCDGVSGPVGPLEGQEDRSTVAEDTRRLLWDLAAHPSVVLWVNEGGEARYHPLFATLREDPLRRPIAGLDMPGRSIGPERPVSDVRGAWIVEQTAATDDATGRFLTAMRAGALGGALVPSPSQPDKQAEWAREWSAAAKAAGAIPLPGFGGGAAGE